MDCRQCLPLIVVQQKGKYCRKPHSHNGVVDTFGHTYFILLGFLSELSLFDTSSLFIRKPVADATAAVAEAKWNVAIEDSKEVVMVSKTGH